MAKQTKTSTLMQKLEKIEARRADVRRKLERHWNKQLGENGVVGWDGNNFVLHLTLKKADAADMATAISRVAELLFNIPFISSGQHKQGISGECRGNHPATREDLAEVKAKTGLPSARVN